MDVAELRFSGDRIDLTHVSPVIFFFDIVYVEKPSAMLIMFIVCNGNPWISCDYMIMNC